MVSTSAASVALQSTRRSITAKNAVGSATKAGPVTIGLDVPFRPRMIVGLVNPSSSIHDLSGHAAILDALMEFAAQYLFLGAVVLLGLVWFRRAGVRACAAAGTAGVLAVAMSAAVGAVWDRPRPFVVDHFTPLIAHAADASFPSDHLAGMGAICVVLWIVSRPLGVTAAVLALIVAFARVFVGVHYVSDVAGGFLLGAICGWCGWIVTGRFLPQLARLDLVLQRVRVRPRGLDANRI